MSDKAAFLGPCIGHTTTTSVKIWIYAEEYKDKKLYIKIYHEIDEIPSGVFNLDNEIPAACITIQKLNPNTKYFYKIFTDEKCNQPLSIDSLSDEDLYFWTMQDDGSDKEYRYDFLVLSCNNPIEAEKKGYKDRGWKVWQVLPQILNETTKTNDQLSENRVLFAILAGDQVYADTIEKQVLNEKNEADRIKRYLNIYKDYWNNDSYRKVLCSLPSYPIWDDHDITDGWGSREDSFENDTSNFNNDWIGLFNAAKKTFAVMQANRNPPQLTNDGFDTAFIVGKAGFILADLRSKRNIRERKIWSDVQFQAVKNWIDSNREKLDVIFFVSPVVFAHGSHKIESGILKYWSRLHSAFDKVWGIQHKFSKGRKKITNFLLGAIFIVFFALSPPIVSIPVFLVSIILFYFSGSTCLSRLFANFIPPIIVDWYYNSIGDLRDDVNDSWSSEINLESTEKILNYFFDIQNDQNSKKQVHVVILTGDIHSAGYSNLYSNNSEHKRCPVIHHVVASPVAYPPFPWYGEAVYRHFTLTAVPVGTSGNFTAQIAHHFTERNAVVCSLRKYDDENLQLKAKFYIEGFPEPQTSVFDLEKSSHKENIRWK